MSKPTSPREATSSGKRFSLKDQLFNIQSVERLAGFLAGAKPEFARRPFVNAVMKKLPQLELKQRIVWIAETLESHLPRHFPAAAAQIVDSLPPPLAENQTDDDFGDFIIAPLGEFVVRNGLTNAYHELSLSTLKEITQRFSMEDAVRAFIRRFPEETMVKLTHWTKDPNYHVRRLVSESTRPLLPWSGRITLPIGSTIPLLDALHDDRTRYVTRSVANHLNDIAKSHPELVIQALQHWHELARQNRDELMWMTRHALRTLVKRGHPGSLKLLGFNPQPKVTLSKIRLTNKTLRPGDSLEFSVNITAGRNESLVVDYAIEFVKAGDRRSTKVFKAAKISLKKGETCTVHKIHKLHAQATTYQIYPGEHTLTLQVNGQPMQTCSFNVVSDDGPN